MNIKDSSKLHCEESKGFFVDDTSGEKLDNKMVGEARRLEMHVFKEMGFYEYVPKEVAENDPRGKTVGVRWVDVRKGIGYRSRLVAQEFAGNDDRDDLFAATPALAATKTCISDAASERGYGRGAR